MQETFCKRLCMCWHADRRCRPGFTENAAFLAKHYKDIVNQVSYFKIINMNCDIKITNKCVLLVPQEATSKSNDYASEQVGCDRL